MPYSGFLIKIGNYTFPKKYIAAESYSVTNFGQDVDSYRNANGRLKRNALNNAIPKVEFSTPALLTNQDVSEIMNQIRSNYTDATEKKFAATVYLPETDNYVSQDMYIADIGFQMYYADEKIIKYNPINFSIVGYGKESNS